MRDHSNKIRKTNQTLLQNIYQSAELNYMQGRLASAIKVLDVGLNYGYSDPDLLQPALKLMIFKGKVLEMQSFFDNCHYSKPIELLGYAVKIARKIENPLLLSFALDELGQAHTHKFENRGEGSLSLPEEYYSEALQLAEKLSDLNRICWAKIHLGQLNELKNERDTALKYFGEVKESAKGNAFQIEYSFAIRHQAKWKLKDGKIEEAFQLFKESLELREKTGLRPFLPFSYISMGDVYLLKENLKDAEENYQKALWLSEQLEAGFAEMVSYFSLANYFKKQSDTFSAQRYFQQAFNISEKINYAPVKEKCETELKNSAEL